MPTKYITADAMECLNVVIAHIKNEAELTIDTSEAIEILYNLWSDNVDRIKDGDAKALRKERDAIIKHREIPRWYNE